MHDDSSDEAALATPADNSGLFRMRPALREFDIAPGAPEDEGLTAAQFAAANLVVQGFTDGEVAKAVGVTRQTVNTWRNHNPDFQAALARRRQCLWQVVAERFAALVPRAIDRLAADMSMLGDPNGTRAATRILEMVNRQVPLAAMGLHLADPPGQEEETSAAVVYVAAWSGQIEDES